MTGDARQNDWAIQVESAWLSFRVKRDRPTTIKEMAVRMLRGRGRGYSEELFWALQDVSFTVRRGERLGVIGPNGSGKTTLLSLIAGIYPPDKGRTTTRGRTVGLLGLGVGFDPEMTGRENIYLNASLFGLTRRTIDERIDDIIAFADIGDFIDSPVRTYSTGMATRVGFAVAAHIDADILLLDEILAVGDAQFKQKSMARTLGLREAGKTLILVSHELDAVSEMCHRAIWLEHGRIVESGPVDEVIEAYERRYAPDPA
jgi:ABC-type polysaccharide/polyol phosphate transport system ATPase subunit